MPRLLILLLSAFLALFLAAQVSATPVKQSRTTYAWSYAYNYYGDSIPIYGCPSSSCVLTNELGNGSWISMVYWTDCQWYSGNYASPRWFYVYYWVDEWWAGWVHSSYVYQQKRVSNWAWNC